MIAHEEFWKDIPGTKGYYQASTLGNIRSVERKLLSGKKCSSKLIKPILSNKYYSVSICTTNKKNIRVHKLVAMAFLECPKANNLQINHINGNRLDNRPENLEWVTPSENIQHALRENLFNPRKGNKYPCSKITEKDVKVIRNSYGIVKQIELSKIYGVSKSAINNVIKRRTWKHV